MSKEFDIEIGKLFDAFEKYKGQFKLNEEYDLFDKDIFQVKNENDKFIDVIGLVKKQDEIIKLYFNDNSSIEIAKKHLFYNNGHLIEAHTLKEGDILNNKIITKIELKDINTVYDIQVNSPTFLYKTTDGLIHHNSISLVNLAANYVKMGLNVVYVTLELSEKKVLKRFISHFLRKPAKDISNNMHEIYNILKDLASNRYGKFIIKYFPPNSLNSASLESYLRDVQKQIGPLKILIVDYAGLMVPNDKNWNGLFERDKYVSEELRSIAVKNEDMVIYTADQFNRCIYIEENVITKNGIKKIKDIEVGDEIKNNEGYVKVLKKFPIKKQKVYKITLEDGKEIIVSEKHVFPKLLNNNIVNDNIATSLKVGDELIINEN